MFVVTVKVDNRSRSSVYRVITSQVFEFFTTDKGLIWRMHFLKHFVSLRETIDISIGLNHHVWPC